VQERVYARHAGLGWIGKNTCLINPEIGSWILLAGMATSLPLEPDTPGFDQCGACTLCLDACPTGAIVDAHVLDATRCISYLTIELEGSVPDAQRTAVGDHLFGCDICQDVCPWNLAPPLTSDAAWQPRVARDGASAAVLWQRTDRSCTPVRAARGIPRAAAPHLALAIGTRATLACPRPPGARRAQRPSADAGRAGGRVGQGPSGWQRRIQQMELRSDEAASPAPVSSPCPRCRIRTSADRSS
jgi:ferredoxin